MINRSSAEKQHELRHKYSMVFYLFIYLIYTSNSMNTHCLLIYSSSYLHNLAQKDADGGGVFRFK